MTILHERAAEVARAIHERIHPDRNAQTADIFYLVELLRAAILGISFAEGCSIDQAREKLMSCTIPQKLTATGERLRRSRKLEGLIRYHHPDPYEP